MSDKAPHQIRLRFFGLGDYGTFFQTEQAFDLLGEFDGSRTDYTVNDIIEFHHAALFAERDLFPPSSSENDRESRRALIPAVRRTVGTFFRSITDANFAERITDVDHQYRTDVLELLASNDAFDRCSAAVALAGLRKTNIRSTELLTCQLLVRTYGQEVRALLLSEPRNAEHLIAKYLRTDPEESIYLPACLTAKDRRQLLEAYLNDKSANSNFVGLIATARVDRSIGIDAKLKLLAQRKHEEHTRIFFESNEGIKTGVEVSIVNDQVEVVTTSLDGMVGKYTYSRDWLVGNLDYPTILNNFIYVFQFVNSHMILELPSYPAQLGVFERFLVTTGKDSYQTGAAFQHTNQASHLQTMMYDDFLRSNSVELEAVIAWFFTDYLREEFGAEGLRFTPSSSAAPYLQKSRHLFSEMESVLKQFSLYAENGELDRELLTMSSEQLSYRQIPSLLGGKYVYATSHRGIQRIQHLLFSDQSHMCYVRQDLQAEDFARLIVENTVVYDDFADFQKPNLDVLVADGIIEVVDGRIQFRSVSQFRVLKSLWEYDAASYYHYSPAARQAIDEMVEKEWLDRRASLLTSAEASYMNYFLNQSEFSDGPDLRNRYLHGSQADGEDGQVHFNTYMVAVRLLIALVIKINDDFNLRSKLNKTNTRSGN